MPRNLTAILVIMGLGVLGVIVAKRIPGIQGLI